MGKRNKKPVVIIDSFNLYYALTGIRTYIMQLCEAVEKNNEELRADYIIIPDWRRANDSDFLKGRLSILKKLINHLSYFIWKQLILPLFILFHRADVVICPDFVSPYFNFGRKILPVIHDVFFWELKSHYNPVWRNYFVKMIEASLHRNTLIIATSEYTKDKIEKFMSPDLPIEVVYQCAKPLQVNEDIEHDVLNKFGLEQKGYFLHVGYFDKRKNLPLLIRAFGMFLGENPTSTLKLVLAGSRGLSDALDDYDIILHLINDLHLNDRVCLTGFISDEALAILYSHANCFVFPSYDEGFGIPVLEAMNFNLPVIISNRGASSEIAKEACLVFESTSEMELSLMMKKVQNGEVRSQLVEKGKIRRMHFTQQQFIQQFDRLIYKYMNDK
ncbi:MAG: glycosyltransferase family 4 protein [Cyclobacteriaceae bacterium]|nr:glycosyltransferase family 4 protein [Cyclobacteriaceae bacterium]